MKNFLEKLIRIGRKKHNDEVLERMKDGDSLQRYSAQSSWYPPRPVVKKDPVAIAELYGARSEGSAEKDEKQELDEKPK